MTAPTRDARPRMILLAVAVGIAGWWIADLLPFEPGTRAAGRKAVGITLFVVTTWLADALPLGAASLAPMVLFPLFGVRPTGDVTRDYAHPILWLFFGGFVLGLAIERWGLHRRIALQVLAVVGPYPRRLVLGFLGTGLLLSMWISNTATSLMLLPIGWALVDRIQSDGLLDERAGRAFGVATMLGIGYGCSVGGMATPIGTAPNALFFSNWDSVVKAGGPTMPFVSWLAVFAPFAIALGLVIWLVLTRLVHRLPGAAMAADGLVREARELPPMDRAQRRVLALFGLAVLLWVTRGDIDLGGTVIRGWASRLIPGEVGPDGNVIPGTMGNKVILDAVVAVGVAILAFAVPSGVDSRRIMDWETTRRIPYDILFLLGGGIAIAGAMNTAGVSDAFGKVLEPVLGDTHPMVLILLVTLCITFLTEVSSNTAITSIFLPVLLAGATLADLDPRVLMLSATIAASCAFMFPIATPPNAVVFSSGHITFGQMARAGFVLNLLSVGLLTLYLWFVGLPLLGVDVRGGIPW